MFFSLLTHEQFDLSSKISKIHGIAANEIEDFCTGMPVSFMYHFEWFVNGTEDLGKRLIPSFYWRLLSQPYIYRRLGIGPRTNW